MNLDFRAAILVMAVWGQSCQGAGLEEVRDLGL